MKIVINYLLNSGFCYTRVAFYKDNFQLFQKVKIDKGERSTGIIWTIVGMTCPDHDSDGGKIREDIPFEKLIIHNV